MRILLFWQLIHMTLYTRHCINAFPCFAVAFASTLRDYVWSVLLVHLTCSLSAFFVIVAAAATTTRRPSTSTPCTPGPRPPTSGPAPKRGGRPSSLAGSGGHRDAHTHTAAPRTTASSTQTPPSRGGQSPSRRPRSRSRETAILRACPPTSGSSPL